MINVGIIGMGKMGLIRLDAIHASGKARVVAAFDVVPGNLPGVQWMQDPMDVIQSPSVQAVFIATPNFKNRVLTIAAIENGKHVFCEKPPAFTAAEASEIRVLLARNWFPTVPGAIDLDRYLDILRKDKKNVGKDVRVILTRGLGDMFLTKITLEEQVRAVIADCFDHYREATRSHAP